jgi:hypothetical protein
MNSSIGIGARERVALVLRMAQKIAFAGATALTFLLRGDRTVGDGGIGLLRGLMWWTGAPGDRQKGRRWKSVTVKE